MRDPAALLDLMHAAAWRRRVLIIIPVLLMPPLGFVASVVAPKRYEARTTLLVQEPAKLNPFLNDLAVGPNIKERMPALNLLLHSEHVLDKVLRDIGRVDMSVPRERDAAIVKLSGAVVAKLVGGELVEISVSDNRPDGLAALLSAISNRFVERMLSPERSAMVGTQSFLEGQLAEARDALTAAEKEFTDFKTRNADKIPALQTANVMRLTGLQQKLEERSMELVSAEAAFDDLRLRLASINPVVGRLEESIVQVSGELTSLRARYTDDHSEVQAAERKLRRLGEERSALLAEGRALKDVDLDRLWNMAAGAAVSPGDKAQPTLLVSQMLRLQEAQSRRLALRQDVQQLRSVIADLQQTMQTFAPVEQEQQRFEHAIATARDMRDSLAKRYDMARMTGALGRFEGPERVKIIDSPADPTSPSGPGRILFILAGVAAGLLLGGSLATLAELFDKRLRSDEDFAATGFDLIARMPYRATLDGMT